METQSGITIIGEADCLTDSLGVISCLQPEIVIIGSSVLGVNTVGSIGLIKEHAPGSKVLVLALNPDPRQLREAIDAGAYGYACKQRSSTELVMAINAIVSGGVYVEPLLVHELLASTNGQRHSLRKRSTELSLRERDVVQLIAQGHTNKEVASRLGISTKSVETYKARSAGKLGLQSRSDFVRYALDQGWLQPKLLQ